MLLARDVAAEPDAVLPLIACNRARHGDGRIRLSLFLAWLSVAGWLAYNHVMWRDEVRALTMSQAGDIVWAMLAAIHDEGHPALWYLLLRAAHRLTGLREVLPTLAFLLGGGAAALFAWRAPFRPVVIASALFAAFFLHEYTVMARNYGVSMLLMFAFACLYGRWRDQGVGLGMVLALLSNTNVPSVLMAAALALFWGLEILCADGLSWTSAWRRYLLNMGVMLIGVFLCVLTVYPPSADAISVPLTDGLRLSDVVGAAFNIAPPMSALLPDALMDARVSPLLLTAMVVGSALGLIRSPGGFTAAMAAALGTPLFFQLIYPGSYRHEALYIVLLLTLYWLVLAGHGGRWPARPPVLRGTIQRRLRYFGQAALLALLLTQVVTTGEIVAAALHGTPNSRSRDLADLLRREGLGRAIVMADADVMLEALPFYADNPIWLVRARRWGRVVPFRRQYAYQLGLPDLLATARALRAHMHRPVVIVLQAELDAVHAQHISWGYLGTMRTTPREVRDFAASTIPMQRFGPARTDESYAVYRLR